MPEIQRPVTLGIIEPFQVVQYALSTLFSSHPELQIVGVESDGKIGTRMLLELMPRIAIVEIDLPSRSGFDIASEIRMRHPATKIIFYTAAKPDIYIEHAVRAKVAGYVLKTDSVANLMSAVLKIAGGGSYFSDEIRDRITIDPTTGNSNSLYEGPLAKLSQRQVEVLRNLALGLSVKEVAKKMDITPKSVDSHSFRIMNALDIHDRVSLARYAIREGLVSA